MIYIWRKGTIARPQKKRNGSGVDKGLNHIGEKKETEKCFCWMGVDKGLNYIGRRRIDMFLLDLS